MLEKKLRLTRSQDFRKVLKKGKTINTLDLILKFYPNEFTYPRFGIIVSTKISKKSTERNRVRRRLREILRKALAELKLSKYDYAIIPRKSVLGKKYQDLELQLEKALRQIKPKK